MEDTSSGLGVVLVCLCVCACANLPCNATRKIACKIFGQGRILAVWILAAKLPNSVLNFAVDFGVDFSLLFFPRKKKSTRKSPAKFTQDLIRKISPRISAEAFS